MLNDASAETTLPVKDLDRARAFFRDKLELNPDSEGPVGIRYRLSDGTRFRLFRSAGSASGSHTQLAFMVQNISEVVRALKERGITFEEYDGPRLKTVDSVADLGYAKAAWFKDPDGNLFGIGQLLPTG